MPPRPGRPRWRTRCSDGTARSPLQPATVTTPAADCVVRLRDVRHRYGAVAAADGISLDIPAGCMVGFIGPDGVGKSTWLGLIAGARRIQSGQVEVLGGDMAVAAHRQRVCPRIAYMPQGLGRNLYPTLSVRENVDFFGRLFGQDEAERRQRIAELLDSTGLAPFAERQAQKLSGGMKQKLGLCCALIHDPDLLILDEPTTGVDPLSRRQFWELIDRIRARRPGMSVLVATAYMEEAERFDWLVAAQAGAVLATGTPAELRARSAAASLEEAFIALLPEAQRGRHREIVIPPRPADGAAIAIEARELTMRFGDFTAVDRVSMRVERGEIFGFLGSNGCGKSTTMKMLTGLLPPSAGEALLFGRTVDPQDIQTRRRVGYMSQAFSLYTELTVRQNLDLHARLFHLPEAAIAPRIAELVERFDLAGQLDALPETLPLGMRQRLQLAVAVLHRPEMLILDEPTSGVDPVARDHFWELIVSLSRQDGVTIFISTHFMNEAQRCDRISLMHAGRVLATDSPAALTAARGCATLEAAFIAYLEDASGSDAASPPPAPSALADRESGRGAAAAHAAVPARNAAFSLQRLLSYARREATELRRDPIRLAMSLLGSLLLMVIIGYGITMDVENLRYAVLDRDQSLASQHYALNISGSRYFVERPALSGPDDIDRRMRSGDISLAVEIPPNFGRDLERGERPRIGVWVDGAMPFRGETIKGYIQALHYATLSEWSREQLGVTPSVLADVQLRYRYNPDLRSMVAMVPAIIPLILMFIPSILTALGVVREKELGSILNVYTTPVTKLEFLLGKQLPYIALSMVSFATMFVAAVTWFGVPFTGSLPALVLGAFLYVIAATALGLLMSTFTDSQVAALAGTAILTLMPAIQFCGLIHPVSSLEGLGTWLGRIYPTAHFLTIARGTFAKGLGFADLANAFLPLLLAGPALLLLCAALLRKQAR